jgi:alcohol dehydrogenase, propanol-preferring
MRAMVLKEQKQPLVLEDIPKPSPKEDDLLIKVQACGVCRTDLHIKEGDLPHPKLPLVLGHEIVGIVEETGKNVRGFKKGDRVGVPWLGKSCGRCAYCIEGQENLCEDACYTGYQINGGFADYALCHYDYAVHLPSGLSDQHIAPLLCAGLIGYRAYRKASAEKTLGLYGFGAAAHILTQIAISQGKEVYAFTREADRETQDFARRLGAIWAGDSIAIPPTALDAAIIFAPVGSLVPLCLKALKKGGRCICGGIHMSDIPSFPYKDLWGEKSISSVANLTRRDAKDFFALIPSIPLKTEIHVYPLEEANQALDDLKNGKFQGAAVLDLNLSK